MALVQTRNLKFTNPIFGQLVIGPPGSGKTTYCEKVTEFYKELDRKVSVVNLDPANENMKYEAEIDVMQLISVEDAMNHFNLGPNGALMYCMEYLETNFDWLLEQLKKSSSNYFIFDCPGQVELYTHHKSMGNIFEKLEKLGYHLCTVHLIDSHYCSQPTKFISTLLLSLNTMLQMKLPHVNVLSKADLLKQFESKLLFNLDFYTDVLDLQYLIDALDASPGFQKYKKLNAAIVSMVEDYSLVSFQPLDVNRKESLLRLKNLIDKANGYCYGAGEEKNVNALMACAVGAENELSRMSNDVDPYV
ncbi:GPN2 family protein [Megaselia abdita]